MTEIATGLELLTAVRNNEQELTVVRLDDLCALDIGAVVLFSNTEGPTRLEKIIASEIAHPAAREGERYSEGIMTLPLTSAMAKSNMPPDPNPANPGVGIIVPWFERAKASKTATTDAPAVAEGDGTSTPSAEEVRRIGLVVAIDCLFPTRERFRPPPGRQCRKAAYYRTQPSHSRPLGQVTRHLGGSETITSMKAHYEAACAIQSADPLDRARAAAVLALEIAYGESTS